jgi:hypothetical protein
MHDFRDDKTPVEPPSAGVDLLRQSGSGFDTSSEADGSDYESATSQPTT